MNALGSAVSRLVGTGLRAASTKAPRILMTGASGQIGIELTRLLRGKYGAENVIASDVCLPNKEFQESGPFAFCDVTSLHDIEKLVVENRIDWLIHNAGILSVTAEKNPTLAQNVNIGGCHNVLEIARKYDLRVLSPSSIAAFGPTTPLTMVPDITIQHPTTVYGIAKVYTEILGNYYNMRYGVDFRSLRYPGVVSWEQEPGGGTTDWAVDIYINALKSKHYECFIREDEPLPIMYMDDCLKATIDFLEAPNEKLSLRTYNVTGFSATPKDFENSIKKVIPDFKLTCEPDFRQGIASSWPDALDDTRARSTTYDVTDLASEDWGWNPDFPLDEMTGAMMKGLQSKM